MTTYRGQKGSRYVLGKRIGHGGEGDVFEIEGQPGLVAKLYSDRKFRHLASVVADPRQYLKNKIECMLRSPIDGYTANQAGKRILTVAWPQDLLLDGLGRFVGFTMPAVSSKYSIHTAYRVKERPLLFRHFTWKSSIAIAYNLASAVAYLHNLGIVIGDFNSNNILVDEHGIVTLIDADSFNIRDAGTGRVYKCMVGVPEVLAPELQGKDLAERGSAFSKESDCFSLAVHIFCAIMENYHPFGSDAHASKLTSSGANPVAARIAEGACPYVSTSSEPGQAGAPDIRMLPHDIRDLIDRAFTYTERTAERRDTLSNRPSASEWMGALARLYASSMCTCGADTSHVYLRSYGHCPWCDVASVSMRPTPVHSGTPTPVRLTPNRFTSPPSSSSPSSVVGTPYTRRRMRCRIRRNSSGGGWSSLTKREPRGLWVACMLVGVASGPLLTWPLLNVRVVTGMDINCLERLVVLSVVGLTVGCIIAHHAQDRYQKADRAWPWLFLSLLSPVLVYVGLVTVSMRTPLTPILCGLVGAAVALLVYNLRCGN